MIDIKLRKMIKHVLFFSIYYILFFLTIYAAPIEKARKILYPKKSQRIKKCSSTYNRETFTLNDNDKIITQNIVSAEQRNDQFCKLYLAKSSIPNAGLGVYSNVDIGIDTVLPTNPDLMIPITNRPSASVLNSMENYVWSGREYSLDNHAIDVEILMTGIMSAANGHPALNNVWGIDDSFQCDSTYDIERNKKHASTGAFSYYHGLVAKATKDIKAGMELFADYGLNWYETREDLHNFIPQDIDYNDADDFLEFFYNDFLNQSNCNSSLLYKKRIDEEKFHLYERFSRDFIGKYAINSTMIEKAWIYYKQKHVTSKDLRTSLTGSFSQVQDEISKIRTSFYKGRTALLHPKYIQNNSTKKKAYKYLQQHISHKKVLNLLPSYDSIEKATLLGTRLFHAPKDFIRSQAWLQKHGYCIDNIRTKPSRIKKAGRGAFATTFLKNNTLVAPAPLLHFCHRNSTFFSLDSKEKRGTQLLLNYCFSHKSSSLYLCPYGSHVHLINHDSKKANVAMRWAKNGFHHKEYWMHLPPHRLCQDYKSGLLLEFYATRDIQKDEELFLDYGKDWEYAWYDHDQNWQRKANYPLNYTSAKEYNEQQNEILKVGENMYPKNVYFECLFDPDQYEHEDVVLSYIAPPYESRNYYSYECVLLKHFQSDNSYKARLTIKPEDPEENEYFAIVENIPRSAIIFKDKMYTIDMFLDNVFRHEIGIPDDIFPIIWKDLEKV